MILTKIDGSCPITQARPVGLTLKKNNYAEWRLAQDAAGEIDDRYAITSMQAIRMEFKDWKLCLFMIMHHLNLLLQSSREFF